MFTQTQEQVQSLLSSTEVQNRREAQLMTLTATPVIRIRSLSVVVPVYNEEDNLLPLHRQLTEVLEQLKIDYEIVVIDDGSTDGSFAVLTRLLQEDRHLRVIRFRRNYGQTAAMAAGLSHARGEIIVTLDGDLQNDPQEIPRLLAKLEEGYDLVSGWRMNRQDPYFSRILPSRIANWLISWITGVKLHDYGCTLKVLRSNIAKELKLYGEMHRFIPALAADLGASITELPVNHRPREKGRSKYGLFRTVWVILDLLTVKFYSSYSTRPGHLFGLFGLVCTAIGGGITMVLGLQRLFTAAGLASRPLLLLGILLMVVGVQFLTMGLIGEMLVRTYHESQGKTPYVIRDILEYSQEKKVTTMSPETAAVTRQLLV
jgi:glycosyltransferase involved in cell wall biosynthesis